MSKFEWQTDGDGSWAEQEWLEGPEKTSRRPNMAKLMVLVVAVVAIFVAYLRLEDQAAQTAAAAREDLLATHALLRTALSQGDQELFNTLLSGRDMAWTRTQQELFDAGILLDRGFLGLQIRESEPVDAFGDGERRDADVESVDFTPDLMAAELVTLVPYEIINSAGLTEIVTLRITALYRRGSDRWLLAPPASDFWGGRNQIRRDNISLSYPERDSETAVRLARDLDGLVREACRVLRGLDCPDDLRITLKLDTSPASLLAAAAESATYADGMVMSLPAPSLIGLPIDEAGYQAQYRAYGERVLTSLVVRTSQWECCGHAMVFQALLEWEMSKLGIGSWPVTPDDYARAALVDLAIEDVGHFWVERMPNTLDSLDGWQVYTLLDFLLQRFPRTSVLDMQRELSRRLTLEDWLTALYARDLRGTGAGSLMERLETEWRQAVDDAVVATQEPPPIPLPTQDVIALCSSVEFEGGGSMYRYKAGSGSWQVELSDAQGSLFMNPLRGDETLLLSGFLGGEYGGDVHWQTSIWNGDRLIPLVDEEVEVLSLGQTDPSGRFLTLYTDVMGNDSIPGSALIDLTQCGDGDCELIPLVGLPLWSPNGSHSLVIETESLGQHRLMMANRALIFGTDSSLGWHIMLGNGAGAPLADDTEQAGFRIGTSPFWLNDTAYGYVRRDQSTEQSDEQELVLASASGGSPETIWRISDLRLRLPNSPPLERLNIVDVLANPADPNSVLAIIRDSRIDDLSIVTLDTRTGETKMVLQSAVRIGGSIGISPDSRWLVVAGVLPGQRREPPGSSVIYLVDLYRQNQSIRFDLQTMTTPFAPAYDWSADGKWLVVITAENRLGLIAPEHNYHRLLPHPYGTCASVVWMNP